MIFERWIKSWRSALVENFFLKFLLLLLAVGFLLNATFLKKTDKVVLVPATLEKTVTFDDDKVTIAYIEQMAVYFAMLAGNLSPTNASYNITVLSKYSDRPQELLEELSPQAEYLKQRKVYQAFYPESVTVEGNNPYTTTVGGNIERRIGTQILSREPVIFKISLKYGKFKVWITSLWVEYPERKDKKKQDDKLEPAVGPELKIQDIEIEQEDTKKRGR